MTLLGSIDQAKVKATLSVHVPLAPVVATVLVSLVTDMCMVPGLTFWCHVLLFGIMSYQPAEGATATRGRFSVFM